MKTFKITATFFILFFTLPIFGQTRAKNYLDDRIYAKAKIIRIEKKMLPAKKLLKIGQTLIHLKILTGELKGEERVALFSGESDLPEEMHYKVGNKVFVGISPTAEVNSTEYISIYDIDNTVPITILIILMIISIIAVGRLKGVASLVALTITVLLLFFVLIPLTLKGYPPLPIAVIISIISIAITLPLIAGFKTKTLAAILGAASGIIFSSILAIISGWMLHLSGMLTNEMLSVFYVAENNINLKGLVLAGMIISALGAIMDICISIASSTAEIYNANSEISQRDAFKSVLNIGTDILGSMVNTLILAYVGSSLSLILLISIKFQPGMPFQMVLNYNPVLNEITKSIIGSIGMFISIPLTALISVKLYSKKAKKKRI